MAFLFSSLPAKAIAQVSNNNCPLDRVIFKDKESGREFVALKVGLNQEYRCGGIRSTPYHHPQPRLQEKCGPALGEKVIVGRLDGALAVAVYRVERGVPCCSWHSYQRLDDALLSPKLHEWLGQHEMPVVRLGSEDASISERSDQHDKGPLGGGDFMPVKCRSTRTHFER